MTALRWLLTAPLLVAAYVGVPVGAQVVASYLYWTQRPAMLQDKPFDLRAEVVEKLTGGFWPVPLAVLLFAVCWWMTSAWPRIALLPTVPLAFMSVFHADLRTVPGWGAAVHPIGR